MTNDELFMFNLKSDNIFCFNKITNYVLYIDKNLN